MKTPLHISAVIFLVAAVSTPCFAMMEITEVNKERAEDMGIKVRTKAAGTNDVWVEIEFKMEGQLKRFNPQQFSRVEMRLVDGEKSLLEGGKTLINAALHMKQSNPGLVSVGFTAARDQVAHISVMIVVGSGLMGGGGFELDLKDFVNLERIHRSELKKGSKKSEQDGADQPATAAESKSQDEKKDEPEPEGGSR